MRLFGICITHEYVRQPEKYWTHYWLITHQVFHWYEFSIGLKICIHCGKQKEFQYTLPYLPYNDGSKTVYLNRSKL